METLKKKLSSRKFWAAAVGVILGIALTFGVDGEAVSDIAGAVTALASIIAYITTEGKIDAASVSSVIEIGEELAAELTADEEDEG